MNWLRIRAVRKWIRRQEAAGIDPNAYEIRGYVRGRWPRLSEEQAMAVLRAAAN